MEHLFWHFLRVGYLLVVGGLFTLVLVIPLVGSVTSRRTTTKTEFFSARAAYWCVIAGLGILMLLGASLAVRTALGGK